MLVNLLDYVKIISGGTPKTNIPEYWNGNIPWISIDDFRDVTKYVYQTQKTITKNGVINSSTNILEKNDIIVSARGTVGKLALIYREMAFNQSCFGIRVENKLCLNPEYLFYYLKCNINYILKKSQGAIFDSINLETFKYIKINLPPINVQNEIVSILSSIDEQIRHNNTMVNKLQVLGKAIFEHFAINSTNKINVQKIANIIWGQCPEGKNILVEKINNSIPYASGAGDIDDGKLVINPKAYTNNSRRIIEEKTICMSVAGTIGKIGIADDKTSIGRAMLGLYSNSRYGLIYFALLKYSLVLQTQATGAIQKIINNDHLDIIDMPDLTSSQIDMLNKIVDKSITIEKNTKKLTIIKEKLLPLLINGQLE